MERLWGSSMCAVHDVCMDAINNSCREVSWLPWELTSSAIPYTLQYHAFVPELFMLGPMRVIKISSWICNLLVFLNTRGYVKEGEEF